MRIFPNLLRFPTCAVLSVVVLAACGGASGGPVASSAAANADPAARAYEPGPCTQSFAGCDLSRNGQDQEIILFTMFIQGIEAYIPTKPQATALYRRLIGEGLELPSEPMLRLRMHNITLGTGGVPGTEEIANLGGFGPGYTEAALALRVRHANGIEGWYDLQLALNGQTAYSTGRAGGNPKYLATMSYSGNATEGSASATVAGEPSIELSWTGVEGMPLSLAIEDRPIFIRNPVHEGPDMTYLELTSLPPVPAGWLTGTEAPAVPPVTALEESSAVELSYRLDGDLNRMDAETPDPLPDLLAEGESLGDLLVLEDVVPAEFFAGEQHLLWVATRMPGGEFDQEP